MKRVQQWFCKYTEIKSKKPTAFSSCRCINKRTHTGFRYKHRFLNRIGTLVWLIRIRYNCLIRTPYSFTLNNTTSWTLTCLPFKTAYVKYFVLYGCPRSLSITFLFDMLFRLPKNNKHKHTPNDYSCVHVLYICLFFVSFNTSFAVYLYSHLPPQSQRARCIYYDYYMLFSYLLICKLMRNTHTQTNT